MNRENPVASIIFPVKNEGKHVRNTLQSLLNTKTNVSFEIIIVDDASNDECCQFLFQNRIQNLKLIRTAGAGAAMARNIGADYAKGDTFVFCDAHLFFEDYWLDKMIEPIQSGIADAVNPGIGDSINRKTVGFGYRWNENLEYRWNVSLTEVSPSPLLAGGCLAISRKAFLDIGGFERGFRIWGKEDEEISLKLWLFGYRCYIQPAATVLHVFRHHNTPFSITWDDVNFNLMRVAFSHFNPIRIEKCKKLIKHSDPDQVVREVLNSGVLEQREAYFRKRKFDDEWYMNKFEIPF